MGKRAILILIPVVLAIVCGFQYYAYRSEMVEMDYQLEKGEHLLRIARLLEKKETELKARINMLDTDISDIRRILPLSLYVDRFMKRFEAAAVSSGVEIINVDHRESRREFYRTSRLRFRISGPEEGRERLRKEISQSERLVKWIEERPVGDGYDLLLEIYSVPSPVKKDSFDRGELRVTRAERGSRVWLWPFKGKIAGTKERLGLLRSQLRGYSGILKTDAKLRALNKELKMLIDILAHLKRQKGGSDPGPSTR